jgi:hypothetical protein
MTLLTCSAVRRRLQAFYDRELAVEELIAIEAHVSDCPPCWSDLRELEDVGKALRLAAAPGPADDWTGLRPGVIGRMSAEAHESWTARVARAFDDMHLVWVGLGATAATVVCAGAVLSMLHFASPERNDSLAAMMPRVESADQIDGDPRRFAATDTRFASAADGGDAIDADAEAESAPSGSDLNPATLDGRISVPSVPENGIVYATLERSTMQEDSVLPLSAVVTREGRVSGLELLGTNHDIPRAMAIVEALSRGRLEPAESDGSPVAVNLVWLVAHTTVRGKSRS